MFIFFETYLTTNGLNVCMKSILNSYTTKISNKFIQINFKKLMYFGTQTKVKFLTNTNKQNKFPRLIISLDR